MKGNESSVWIHDERSGWNTTQQSTWWCLAMNDHNAGQEAEVHSWVHVGRLGSIEEN